MSSMRLASGGLIDRAAPRSFNWNGSILHGYAGDTLASALLGNGVSTVARSFKYHRRRGVVAAGAEEPNALVQVGRGAHTVPNMKATQVELYEGLSAHSVNCWPSLDFDVGVINNVMSRLLPAGFYYKTFMWPSGLWHTYERQIRRAAGLGIAPTESDPDQYEYMHAHCDVLVIGAGPAGISAALAAARRGARTIVMDEQARMGGSALHLPVSIDDAVGSEWACSAMAELTAMPHVTVLARTTALGLYERNFIIAGERCTDHLPLAERQGVRERLWRIRAREVILATGAIERPLVFANNDLPGVMQADAVLQYVRRYAIRPGRDALVFTNNDSAYATACELAAAGARVRIVDARESAGEVAISEVMTAGIEVMLGHVVVSAVGRARVQGARVMRYTNGVTTGALSEVGCDLIAVSGGWSPALHLHSHGGGRALYDDAQACFVPGDNPQDARSVGSANGMLNMERGLVEAYIAGSDAARSTVGRRKRGRAPLVQSSLSNGQILPLWRVPVDPERRHLKAFVDFQNDTAASDLDLALREGYESIEHVKRYTALGFGTDQGKLGNINGMGIVAENLGMKPGEVGTTTFRPPYTAVTFGAVAGADVGELFDPVRKTAIHEWHAENQAEFEVVGQWLRPWYYPQPGEDMHLAVARECRAARCGAAMMDASTLGKIDVRGPDAAEFLDRVYTNGWKKLQVGRARYGLMLGEDGMVMDDGVSARLADDHFYMTTTTGGAANVYAWLERWLQTEWPDLKIYLTSITDQWATVAVAGPDARAVLERAGTDIDVSADAMPFMSFREGTVAGLPARVFRISFSGESAFEINVPADFGRALWESIYAAGQPFGITPYGTEAMHVLRAEKGFVIVGQDTDGSVTPGDLGMEWIVAKHKDFLGKRSLSRSDCVRRGRKQLVGLLAEAPQIVIPEGAQLLREVYTRLPAPMEGHVTSSYHSGALGRSIALALLKDGHARHGERVYAAKAGGEVIPARVTGPVFYDPTGARING